MNQPSFDLKQTKMILQDDQEDDYDIQTPSVQHNMISIYSKKSDLFNPPNLSSIKQNQSFVSDDSRSMTMSINFPEKSIITERDFPNVTKNKNQSIFLEPKPVKDLNFMKQKVQSDDQEEKGQSFFRQPSRFKPENNQEDEQQSFFKIPSKNKQSDYQSSFNYANRDSLLSRDGFDLAAERQNQKNKNKFSEQDYQNQIWGKKRIPQQNNQSFFKKKQPLPQRAYTEVFPVRFSPEKQKLPDEISRFSKMSSKEGKKKIKIVKECKINENFGLLENKRWIKMKNKSSLLWKNYACPPLEVRIMLHKLSAQADPISVKQLQTIRPIEDVCLLSEKVRVKIPFQLKKYSVYRTIRSDRNCFYRAFNFSFLQMALTHQSSALFLKFLSLMSNISKVNFKTNYSNQIINSQNVSGLQMRKFVIHRLLTLYSYRVLLQEQKDPNWEQKMIKFLQQVFNEPPYCFDTYLIIGLKNLIINHLQNEQQFQQFKQMNEILKQILHFNVECQIKEYNIKSLCQLFKIDLCLFQQIRGECDFNSHGEGDNGKLAFYYKNQHYDIVYPNKKEYEYLNN